MCLRSMRLLIVLFWFPTAAYSASENATAVTVALQGFGANAGSGGAINVGWTGGGLGTTWAEGEWIPYQLVMRNVQSSYPGLAGMPDIVISFDFTTAGVRFIDLVRDIQAGQQPLDGTQGWPDDAGLPYPLDNREDIENAQNDIGNAAPLENVWQLGGLGNFQLLNPPQTQINRALDGGIGTPTSDRRMFRVTRDDLLVHGIPPTADTIVIYYQLHEARTMIWNNSLQSGYSAGPH